MIGALAMTVGKMLSNDSALKKSSNSDLLE
jgi:hypothetical protein